jgi:hypothetical protein
MASLKGVSNQRYRTLFKGKREKLVTQYEADDSDAGQLARLVRQLEYAVTMADKEGFYFNKCPLCGAMASMAANPSTRHEQDCEWPETVRNLRETKR